MGIKKVSSSDIITNSSTEVFCFELDSDIYRDIKKMFPGLGLIEFKTLDDIKHYLTDEDWTPGFDDSGVQCRFGNVENSSPKFDFYSGYEYYDLRESLENAGKTKEEIWEFFKFGYENLVGTAYGRLNNECIRYEGSDLEKFHSWWDDKKSEEYKKAIKEIFSNFKTGDILSFELNNWAPDDWKDYIVAQYWVNEDRSDDGFSGIYLPDCNSPEIGKFIMNDYYMEAAISFINLASARLATEEQKMIFIQEKEKYEKSQCE